MNGIFSILLIIFPLFTFSQTVGVNYYNDLKEKLGFSPKELFSAIQNGKSFTKVLNLGFKFDNKIYEKKLNEIKIESIKNCENLRSKNKQCAVISEDFDQTISYLVDLKKRANKGGASLEMFYYLSIIQNFTVKYILATEHYKKCSNEEKKCLEKNLMLEELFNLSEEISKYSYNKMMKREDKELCNKITTNLGNYDN